jgi:MoxR-like ATPase
MIKEVSSFVASFDKLGYVVDEELATVLFLMTKLQKPLLLEGHPGVGKTEVANILAAHLGTDLIRLQCYEGLDVHSAVYEWNYQKQLLSIKIQESNEKTDIEKEKHIFGKDFLMPRPLLQAISGKEKSPVLLIDEIDRADEEFEAFLLELLSVYQISIPEFGTIKASHPPFVILTSNRTRELSDALRRRCLYHWVSYPDFEKEVKIVHKHLPDIEQKLAEQLVRVIHVLRNKNLEKSPGISETLDWAMSLHALGKKELDEESFNRSLGSVLKSYSDTEKIKSEGLASLLKEST